MNKQEDSKNPISQSLKDFAQEQHRRFPPPSKNSTTEDDKIHQSRSFPGKVHAGRYGAIGDKN